MSEEPQAPYERLLALGICQLELARAGRLQEMSACQAARAQLISTLPADPPPAAYVALARCAAIEERIEIELRRARQGTIAALGELRRAQRAADGYSPARLRPRTIHAAA